MLWPTSYDTKHKIPQLRCKRTKLCKQVMPRNVAAGAGSVGGTFVCRVCGGLKGSKREVSGCTVGEGVAAVP